MSRGQFRHDSDAPDVILAFLTEIQEPMYLLLNGPWQQWVDLLVEQGAVTVDIEGEWCALHRTSLYDQNVGYLAWLERENQI